MNIINLKDSIIYFNEQNIIEYLTLLNSLTTVYSNNQELQNMVTNFRTTVSELPSNTMIYVIMNDKQVIGSGTLLIEKKIIHNYGKVGHIEDIVIKAESENLECAETFIEFTEDISAPFRR